MATPTDSAGGRGRRAGAKALDGLEAGLRARMESLFEENRQAKEQSRLLRNMIESGARFAEATSLSDLGGLALDLVCTLFAVRGAAISTVETLSGGRLTFSRHRGLVPVEPDDLVFEADSSLVLALREARHPLSVSDLVGRTGPRSKERSLLRRLECEVVAPLLRQDRLLGLLLLTRRNMGQPFSRETLELINDLASFLAPVVENILLRAERHPR